LDGSDKGTMSAMECKQQTSGLGMEQLNFPTPTPRAGVWELVRSKLFFFFSFETVVTEGYHDVSMFSTTVAEIASQQFLRTFLSFP
jgi:hypothetical protein